LVIISGNCEDIMWIKGDASAGFEVGFNIY